MPPRTVCFSIEAQVEGESLSGIAIPPTGISKPFSGWLGLLAVIEGLIAAGAAEQPGPGQAHGSGHGKPVAVDEKLP